MSSLNEICYQQIKDNFYYADFQGVKIIVDKKTGYFNATQLCTLGRKQYSNWFKNKKTQELFKSFSNIYRGHNIETKYEINGNYINTEISGNYIHEDLFLNLASWISIEFYVKCKKIIIDMFIRKFQEEKKFIQKQIQLKEKQIELKDEENQRMKRRIKNTKNLLDNIKLLERNCTMERFEN